MVIFKDFHIDNGVFPYLLSVSSHFLKNNMNGKIKLNIGHKYQKSQFQLCHKSWHLLIHKNILQTSQKVARPKVDIQVASCGTYLSTCSNNK